MTARAIEESHYRLLYESDFLCAADLRGKDMVLTIRGVSVDELPIAGSSKTQRKPVVSFEETPKRLVLNRTNGDLIAEVLGKYTAEWAGRQVTVYPTTTSMKKKTVECIRVREVAPQKGPSK